MKMDGKKADTEKTESDDEYIVGKSGFYFKLIQIFLLS
jgi:hypothetical protein